MSRVMLSMALMWSLVAGTVLAQSAGQSSGQRSARQGPRAPAGRPPAGIQGMPGPAPPRQFGRQPRMVMVQALIVTVSFGDAGRGDDSKSAAASPAGSLADALAEKINAEVGAKKTPISALIAALDAVLKEKAKTTSIETLTGLELVTVAGQTAFVQIGHRKPRIIGTSISQRGRSNQIQMENVGSIVQITPRVLPDGSLVVAVDIERSDFAPEEEGEVIDKLKDGSEIRSPQIDTLVTKTTVTTANGQAVVVNDLVRDGRSVRKETFVILRPLVVGESGGR